MQSCQWDSEHFYEVPKSMSALSPFFTPLSKSLSPLSPYWFHFTDSPWITRNLTLNAGWRHAGDVLDGPGRDPQSILPAEPVSWVGSDLDLSCCYSGAEQVNWLEDWGRFILVLTFRRHVETDLHFNSFSQNVSSLPLSTYTLGDPAPLRLGFPSAEALKELLSKHPGVNLQVSMNLTEMRMKMVYDDCVGI